MTSNWMKKVNKLAKGINRRLILSDAGVAEMLMDENALASVPRPGTSLSTPQTRGSGSYDQGMRPVSQSGAAQIF